MPLIGPEHPRYLELFYGAFGAGQSYPARLVKNPPTAPYRGLLEPRPVRCPPSPSPVHLADPGREQQGDPQPDKS